MRLNRRQWLVILLVILCVGAGVWAWRARGHDVRVTFARFMEVNGRRWAVFTIENHSGGQICFMSTTYLHRVEGSPAPGSDYSRWGGGREFRLQSRERGEFYAEIPVAGPEKIAEPFQAGIQVWHPPSPATLLPDAVYDRLPASITERRPVVYWSEVVTP